MVKHGEMSGENADTTSDIEYMRRLRSDYAAPAYEPTGYDAVPGSGDVPPYAPLATTIVTAPPVPPAPSTQEWISCPECGEGAMVDFAQRRAEDFCSNCDFPLFWARSSVVLMAGDETGASLRRLPGTVGRAATASVACPHCGEPNSPAAVTCIRCGLPMVIVEPEPEPEPVYYAPEPEPEPESEPEPDNSAIWIIAICMVVVILAVVLTLILQHR